MPFTPVKRPSIHLWAQIAFLFFGALVAIAPLVAADDEADSADPAPPAATQNAPSGFSLKPPSGFIGVHYGYAIPRVKSDLFDMVTRELTIKKSQFRSSNSGFDFGITIKPRFVAVVSMDYSRILIDSQIRNAPNSSVVQQTEFKELPISVGVRVYPMKIGVKVGKYAWIQRRIAPYISGGVGFLHYDFNQTGSFADSSTGKYFFAELDSSGFAKTANVSGGVDIGITSSIFAGLEGKYAWGHANLSSDFTGFQPIDLSGARFNAGVFYRFR